MSLKVKRELLSVLREEYAAADQAQRKRLLDAFVQATGYNRKYASTLLCSPKPARARKRNRSSKYDQDVKAALAKVWRALNYICTKRLIPFLPVFVPILEKDGYLALEPVVREKLLQMSAATADRLLKSERESVGKGISNTRPGNLLRSQVAVRTFADWDDVTPGFFEIDLVSHCGDNLRGPFIYTLTLTDISSGWTECLALSSKKEERVLEAIKTAQRLIPIDLRGLDSDNGGEFLNWTLAGYCEQNNITFTRSRDYKKNDQAFVEQKNGAIVRGLVGYQRFEGPDAQRLLAQLYKVARLYVNYFQPSLKLAEKIRSAARVKKRYHPAKTPCQRLLESDIPDERKNRLRRTFDLLDPVALLGRMELLQAELLRWLQTGIVSSESLAEITPSPALSGSEPTKLTSRTKQKRKSYYVRKNTKGGRQAIINDKLRAQCFSFLQEDPSLTGVALMTKLNDRYPGSISSNQRHLMDRLVKGWREVHPEHFHLYSGHYKSKNPKRLKGLILNEATVM